MEKTKEQRTEDMVKEYITNRVKGLLAINEDMFKDIVASVLQTPPLENQKEASLKTAYFHENRVAFQSLYEEAQMVYLAELDEGHRLSNMEHALKKAEAALKRMGVRNLITMEEEEAT